MEDYNNPNLDDRFMMTVSSKSGRLEQSKFGWLFYEKIVIQKWRIKIIQIWIIINHFGHYLGKYIISIHYWSNISSE